MINTIIANAFISLITESINLPADRIVAIGLKKAQSGDFIWSVTGQPPSFNNWGLTEPNNSDGNEYCGGMSYSLGQWMDIPCDYKVLPFCQILPQEV